jgi:gliding motility-associated-like protein
LFTFGLKFKSITMNKLLLNSFLILALFSIRLSFVGQVFYTEDFTTGGTGWNLVVPTGANGADPNFFTVSGNEGGGITPDLGAPGSCGAVNSNNTLHITSVFFPTGGAAYDAGGLCGLLFCPLTNVRAESPVINCTGQTNISVNFNYIEGGSGTIDDASIWYFDGSTWALLDNMPKTLTGCGGQGLWTSRTIALPASANNNPNVRIGFNWTNNDDGVGTDPSFAVDDITFSTPVTTTPPIASFTASQTNLCSADCINFTSTSTSTAAGGITAYSWSFTGGIPTASNLQNPTNICYATAGTYAVSLTVTDANGNDTETIAGYITVSTCNPPIASFSTPLTTICTADCINFTSTSTSTATGGISSYAWSFTGATPATSSVQNPTNICYAAAGTYAVSLTVTDANGNDTETSAGYITVTSCATPTATFTLSDTEICAGDCITINNTSIGGTSYTWTFNGGTPSSSTAQNPGPICFNAAGTYSIDLVVANANGSDNFSSSIIVNALPSLDIGNDVTILLGDSVQLNIGGAAGNYTWTPATHLSCNTCSSPFASPTSDIMYTATFEDANGCINSDAINITVTDSSQTDNVIGLPSAFSPNGDGFNEVFIVRGSGIEKMQLLIYNKYGQKVFESTDQTIGWDGTLDGKALNAGVFAYILTYKLIGEEERVLKGSVTLVK